MRRAAHAWLLSLIPFVAACAQLGPDPSKLDSAEIEAAELASVEARCDEELREADALLPPYENREREFLGVEEFARVSRAAEIYRSVRVTAPPNYAHRLHALTHLVHACILLGDDRRYRGFEAAAKQQFADTLDLCSAAGVLGPHYPWLSYKEGIAALALGDDARAARFFSDAIDDADALIGGSRAADDTTGSVAEAQDIRLRAMFDRATSEMRAREYDAACAHFEELLRERDGDHLHEGIHRSMAHISVERGDLETARVLFQRAIDQALDVPYLIDPWIANYVFADSPEQRLVRAAAMLDSLLKAPFDDDALAWKRAVMTFLVWPHVAAGAIGIGGAVEDSAEKTRDAIFAKLRESGLAAATPEALIEFVASEEQRRNGGVAEIPVLRGSAWFYIGVALESRAESTADPAERASCLERARAAFAQASTYENGLFCWEIEHARHRVVARDR